MKKFILLFFIFHFSFFISAKTASAHVLKTDGSIGAVLHVSPDDDPIAGVPTDFFFELKDKNGKFAPENCDCVVRIIENGKVTLSQSLFALNAAPSLEDASFRYTLAQKGVYTIQLIGSPKDDKSFKRFELSWDIRVEREALSKQPTQANWLVDIMPYIIGVGIFIGLIVLLQKKGGGKRNER